jgi:hypothetical protein
MKKVTKAFLVVFVSSLFLASCSKDDDNNSVSTSGNIVGKWEHTKDGVIVNNQEILEDYVHEAGCAKDNVEFKANNIVISTEYSSSCVANVYSQSYAKNGNTLTVTDGTDSTVLTVLQLDANTLKVKYIDDSEGSSVTYVEVYTKG